MLSELREHLPELDPIGVAAGLHVFCWLPPGIPEARVVELAAADGLIVFGAQAYHVAGSGPGRPHHRLRQARRGRDPRRRPDTALRDPEGHTVGMSTTSGSRGADDPDEAPDRNPLARIRRRLGRIRPDLVSGSYRTWIAVAGIITVGLAAVILIPTLTDAVAAEGEGAIAQFIAPSRFRLAVHRRRRGAGRHLGGLDPAARPHPASAADSGCRAARGAAGRDRAVPGIRPRRRRGPRCWPSSPCCPPSSCSCWRICRRFAPRTRAPRGSASSAPITWLTLLFHQDTERGGALGLVALGVAVRDRGGVRGVRLVLRRRPRGGVPQLEAALPVPRGPASAARARHPDRLRAIVVARLTVARELFPPPDPDLWSPFGKSPLSWAIAAIVAALIVVVVGACIASPAHPVRRATRGRGARGARQPAPRGLGRGDRRGHGDRDRRPA